MLHSDRCIGVLKHVRPHLVPAIGDYFVQEGWIDEESLEKALRAAAPTFGRKRSRFLDEEMEDAASNFSDNDSTEDNHDQ